jgi:hypothetical protein
MPPPFWQFLTRRWLGVSPDLAQTWWGALTRSRWSEARTFYQAVLRYDAHPAPAQRPSEDKLAMSGLVEPQALMQLVEDLVAEHVLLRREGSMIQEAILTRLDATGAWREERRSM